MPARNEKRPLLAALLVLVAAAAVVFRGDGAAVGPTPAIGSEAAVFATTGKTDLGLDDAVERFKRMGERRYRLNGTSGASPPTSDLTPQEVDELDAVLKAIPLGSIADPDLRLPANEDFDAVVSGRRDRKELTPMSRRNTFACLIVALTGWLLPTVGAQDSRSVDASLESVRRLAESGRTVEAVEALDALLVKFPESERLHSARFNVLDALVKEKGVAFRPRLLAAARAYLAVISEGKGKSSLQKYVAKLEAAVIGMPPIPEAPAPSAVASPKKAEPTDLQMIEIGAVANEIAAAVKEDSHDKKLAVFRSAMKRLQPLSQALPDELHVWQLLALTALELDDENEGRRSAAALLRLGAAESQGLGAQRLMKLLNAKGWLQADPKAAPASIGAWAEVQSVPVDPEAVRDPALRSRIEESGLPWRVKDRRTGIEFLLIPAGTYRRGASAGDAGASDDEKPAHEIHIKDAFYLARTELTNAQYRRFKSEHDSGVWGDDSLNADAQPVVNVSWNDAVAFCARNDFRLPTEAEWEYACRAGTETKFPWGAVWIAGQANGDDSADGFSVTAPVGRFPANGLGLHDMIGNVWEWCATTYDADEYARCAAKGESRPSPPTAEGDRVMRGGAFYLGTRRCRSSDRGRIAASYAHGGLGFRPARTVQ